LENLSHDPEQEYFADGITDELITELAKLSALRVISRTSVQRYKRSTKPIAEIARRLKVDALLEGTVFRSESRIRITAQLISAQRDEHLWAETYERDLGDVLKLQAEVTQAIAKQVHIRLSTQEKSRLSSARGIDPAAYECYLRGRYFWNKRTEDDLKRAQEYFDGAIEKAPYHALAHSGLADTYLYLGYVFGRMDPREAMPKAKAAAIKALELDPTLAEAHTSLGFLRLMFEWDFAGAAREFQVALELNRNYPTTHHFYSALLAVMGRTKEAIEEVQRALILDPLSVPINNMVGEIYMFAGQLDLAIAQYQKALELDPNTTIVHDNLGTALELQGKDKEALEEYLKAGTFWGEKPESILDMRRSFELGGWSGFRQRRVELALSRRTGWHFESFQIATLYASLGDDENALTWLEKACNARSAGLIWITVFPFFKKLFWHPRFRAIAEHVGLPMPSA
jgi:TolB-like protein/Tfp pilus assembly protein PilF